MCMYYKCHPRAYRARKQNHSVKTTTHNNHNLIPQWCLLYQGSIVIETVTVLWELCGSLTDTDTSCLSISHCNLLCYICFLPRVHLHYVND